MAFGDISGKSTTNWTNDEILSEATAQSLGLSAGATPDAAFGVLNGSLSQFGHVYVGNYVGNGLCGASHPNSITVNFPIKFVCILIFGPDGNPNMSVGKSSAYPYQTMDGLNENYTQGRGIGNSSPGTSYGRLSSDKKTFSWYVVTNDDHQQFNKLGVRYYYLVHG